MTRPVTTMSAPPREGGGDAEAAEVGVGGQRALRGRAPRRGRAGRRPRRGRSAGSRPRPRATSRSRSARPAGLRPPAFATIRTPRSSASPRLSSSLPDEGARVAEGGVLHRVLAEDQHGQLGEVVAGEHVEAVPVGAALEHLAHRGEPVAVEAGAVADPERRSAHRRASRPAVRAGRRRPARCRASGRRRRRSATRSVSSRCRRWVTSRQKSYAEPRTDCAASVGPPGPGLARRARRSSTRNSSAGGSSPCTENAKSRVRTPRWATWRIRSVGVDVERRGRRTRRARAPRSP